MIRWLTIVIAFALVATACWRNDPPRGELPVGYLPDPIPPVARQAVELEGDGARLYEVVRITWPSGCFGLERQLGTACTAGEVPGYRIWIERRGWLIEYRSGEGTGHILRAGVLGEAKYYYNDE